MRCRFCDTILDINFWYSSKWFLFLFADRQFGESKRKNEAMDEHVSKLSDTDSSEMVTKEANEGKKNNQKCQENVNGDVQEDEVDDGEKTDAKNIAQQHLALEALENTKVAVAQFAAAALSKGVNESSIKDLTMLQSALFTLQHQQVFQMQIIEQLQYQLAKTNALPDKKRKQSQPMPKTAEPTELNQDVATEENEFTARSIEW